MSAPGSDADSQAVAARLSAWLRAPASWAHQCEECGRGAAFGFEDMRKTMHWFCSAHRASGEALLRAG
ncbi:hypothetical protein HLH33_13770 [Gluconacetobacter diazotrophicus]|uniref:Uncharacterized protein n=1 Tax=Gluconacetobacter diazotrophicus TaxID=33996 RepID=A0A7W4I6W9_GLUDI|nr:hypothetical protein [Gluconacetobacter diazotrophicus]MBB2157367.1 hypothetical protein [Gluconacetobacter diazotrophicus]